MFAYLASGIRAQVDIPVMAGHRINDPQTARQLIADGMCDIVAMGRSLIADPQMPRKAQEGREKDIVHCIACAQGCFDNLFKLKPVECLCNPKAGYEKDAVVARTAKPQKVMVIGGGAAGMSAALAAAEKGHNVTLYEKDDRLGGQLYLAGSPPGREEFAELASDLAQQVALSNIKLRLSQPVDESVIKTESPDAVILSTGSEPVSPPVTGTDLPHVVQSWDVLSDNVITGRRVVIIGGGAVGIETALYLAEKGTLSGEALKFLLVNRAEDPADLYEMAIRGTKEIVVVEMIEKLGKDIGKTTKWGLLQEMSRRGIKTKTTTRAIEITANSVRVEKDAKIEEIPADTVVLAMGASSFNPLAEVLENLKVSYTTVGDASQVGMAFDAVHQGYRAGKSIE